MSQSINCTPSKIIQWFTDGEKCLMHSNIAPVEVLQINLSNDNIDELIEKGKKILMNNLQLKIESLKFKIKPGYAQHISVDEGWYQIVLDCDKELTAIDPNYCIFQIKEKFGGLRFYFEPSNLHDAVKTNLMHQVIRKYEVIASQTCEATGRPGVLMKSPTGYLRTLNPQWALSSIVYQNYKAV